RGPLSVSRSPGHGICGLAPVLVQASGAYQETHFAQSGGRFAAGGDSVASEDGVRRANRTVVPDRPARIHPGAAAQPTRASAWILPPRRGGAVDRRARAGHPVLAL